MKKADVQIGKTYIVTVSGHLAHVRIIGESPYGGWYGRSLATGRKIRVKTATRLRSEVKPEERIVIEKITFAKAKEIVEADHAKPAVD